MLFKRRAISSLLIELDSDDLPQSKRGQLSDALAQEVLDLVQHIDCATALIEREERIIEQRGNNPSSYLMNSEISTRDVLRTFYKSIYYDNDGKKHLIPNLTISELMIMLGVFEYILQSREEQHEQNSKELKTIRRKTNKRYSYFQRKPNGIEELNQLFSDEEKLEKDSTEELIFISILDENMQLLEVEICKSLGIEQLNNRGEHQLTFCSTGLVRSYDKINAEVKKRKKEIPSLFDDILLLECCGEDTENLQRVYQYSNQRGELDYRLMKK